MSGSNRGAGSSALTEQVNSAQAGQQGTNGNNANSDNQGNAVALPVEQSPSPIEPVEGQPQAQTEQPNPYGKRDIIAQETMADASVGMAIAAFMTFIVTVVGTLLIRAQVKLTREAVVDTGEATKAMHDANLIAEKTQQAWLILSPGEIEIIPHSGLWYVKLEAENIGPTPAQVILTRANWADSGHFRDFDEARWPPDYKFEQTADITIRSNAREVLVGLNGVNPYTERAFVFGSVDYRTAFGKVRRSYFGFRISEDNGTFTMHHVRRDQSWPQDT